MASIALWYPPTLRCPLTVLSNNNKGTPKFGKKCAVLCCNKQQQQQQECGVGGTNNNNNNIRRHILVGMSIAFASFSFTPILSNASAETDVVEGFRIFTDDVNKFKMLIPQDWQVAAGEPNGFKSVTAFYPEENNTSSNVTVVITGLGPDFTKIESFGKVDEFAETLVSGLDRSWQRPPGVAAKLINCKSSKGFYYIEYSLQKPGETRRILFTALGMASNGWYNRLYTITGQFEEKESDSYGSKIEKAVTSFRFI